MSTASHVTVSNIRNHSLPQCGATYENVRICCHGNRHPRIAVLSCSQAQPAPESPRTPAASEQSRQKGWLGVSVGDVDAETAKHSKLKETSGALVREVVEDSPAATSRHRGRRCHHRVQRQSDRRANDLVSAVRKAKPGENVPVVVARHDQKKSLQVKIGKLPADAHRAAITVPPVPQIPPIHMKMFHGSEMGGLRVMDLNSQLGEYFGAPYGKGVLVERVKGKSAAANAGFKAGDVIVKLGKEEIGQTEDLWSAMDEYSEGDTATFQIPQERVQPLARHDGPRRGGTSLQVLPT